MYVDSKLLMVSSNYVYTVRTIKLQYAQAWRSYQPCMVIVPSRLYLSVHFTSTLDTPDQRIQHTHSNSHQ